MVHDPLYAEAELRGLRLEPYRIGEPCDAAIVQTDHPEYNSLAPADLPGVRALVDGRAVTDPGRWSDIPRRVIGLPAGSGSQHRTHWPGAGGPAAGQALAHEDNRADHPA